MKRKSPRPLLTQPWDSPLVREILGGDLCNAFELLDICGEECERAGVIRTMPSEVWRMLAPSDAFAHTDTRVYRSHVRELVRRYKTSEPYDLGTEAEVLLGLVQTSQVAPLTQGGAALYHRLFRSVVGPEAHDSVLDGMEPPRERWKGQADELLHEARRKVRTGRPRRVVG